MGRQVVGAVIGCLVLSLLAGAPAAAVATLRVNAGGGSIAGTPTWTADLASAPSPYVNASASGSKVLSTSTAVTAGPSVPAGTPAQMFQTERYDPVAGSEMLWSFPVTAGQYDVRLYFAETYAGTQSVGARKFDVSIEGALKLNDYDIFADAGGFTGVMKQFRVTSDSTLNVAFAHVVQNPTIRGIEILPVTSAGLAASPGSLSMPSTTVGSSSTATVTLSNTAATGGADVVISGTTIAGADASAFIDSFNDGAPVTLAPGASIPVTVTFQPVTSGAKAASLSVTHNGAGSPLTVPLSGAGTAATSGPTLRVNAGGGSIAGTPTWTADLASAPSPYVNASASGSKVLSTSTAVTAGPSVPAGTPAQMFQTERYDPVAGSEMLWSFPVTAGQYDVRLYFAETYAGTQSVGARKFDVSIEGALKLNDYDIFADAGGFTGVMKQFRVTSDSTLNVAFAHVVQNPTIRGIEILPVTGQAGALTASPTSMAFGPVATATTKPLSLQLTNAGAPGDPGITVSGTSLQGADPGQFSDSFLDSTPITLAPGASTTITVSFSPSSTGDKAATLSVAHNGTNGPLLVPLTGTGTTTSPVGFGKSLLAGETSSGLTSMAFGPDGKLYAAQFNGLIKIYTVARSSANSYAVTATQTVDLVQKIPNHNDNGALNTSVTTRIITGILITGTAANPVIYASSSDPRIGGGDSGEDLGLDTNSSTISRLTWNGSTWSKVDLVRGLPRSEENHSANGMAIDPATNTLYVAQGGNTNAGAPSNNFARLPEFALSAAILSVDLDAIGNAPYDLPTLDDDSRAGTADSNDPFGGNNGKNQARLVPGGPVQVYSPGFRNPYDIVRASNGKMYTIDNGANAGWGDIPVNEGPAGNCTNGINEPGPTYRDTLHVVTAGYYGGHANPTRANMANTFNSNGQSPVSVSHAIECDTRAPGTAESTELTSWAASTNGITEYTASNFGGAMKGDLLTAGYVSNSVSRVELSSNGNAVVSNTSLFSTVGARPLDLAAQGDSGALPGTIWVGDQGNGNIYVFEPNDFGGGGSTCTGADNPTLDEDADSFDNADEIDNATNPCSSADVPPDADGDHTSDLNDPDDDNDGQTDTTDPFALDAQNGLSTSAPVNYSWDNGAPNPGGLLELGFTGLMTNGTANYASLFDSDKMTAGGAAGVTTVDQVSAGTAAGASNNQQYAFQFGVNPGASPLTAHTRLLSPWSGLTPSGNQSMGLYVGNGTQSGYVSLVATAGSGSPGIQAVKEASDAVTQVGTTPVTLPGPSAVDLYLTVDPVANTVRAAYTTTTNGATGPLTAVGSSTPIPAGWLTSSGAGLAVGIISTSAGAGPFPATWDFIEVLDGVPSPVNADPASVSFPATPVSATSNQVVSVTNDGTGQDPAVQVTAVGLSGPDASQFSVTTDPLPVTLARDSSTPIQVTFAPTSSGAKSATMSVSTAGGPGLTVPLSGSTATGTSTVVTDSFARTVSGGWGSADVGGTWSIASGTADFSVGTGRGTVVVSSTRGERVALLPASAADLDARYVVSFSAKPPSGGVFSYLLARRQSGGAHLRVGAFVDAAGGVALRGQTNSGAYLFADVATGLTYTAGTPLTVRVSVTGSNPTTVRAKVWPSSGTEPSTWAVTATTSATGLQGTGTIGFRASSTSTSDRTLTVDDLIVSATGSAPTATWRTLASTGLARQEVAYVKSGSKFYLAGGSTAHQAYDPATNTWTTLAPLPANIDHIQGVALNGLIYYVGGLQSWPEPEVSTVYIYNPTTNSFTTGAAMPRSRGAGGVAVHNSKIYYAGGLHAGSAVAWFDVYDPATDSWSQLPDMPRVRDHFQAAVVDGVLYAIGGRNTAINATTTANDAFRFSSGSWETGRAPLPTARGGFAAAAVGQEIVVIGGEGGGSTFSTVEAYNTVTNSWRTLPPMPTARHGIQGVVCAGSIYVAAGSTVQGRGPTSVQEAISFGPPQPCTG